MASMTGDTTTTTTSDHSTLDMQDRKESTLASSVVSTDSAGER